MLYVKNNIFYIIIYKFMQIFNYNKTYKLQIFIVKWGMNSTMIFLIKKGIPSPHPGFSN